MRHITKPFPQHVVPDELSLLSRYEMGVYILLFLACFVTYCLWNRVPIIKQTVVVDRLISASDRVVTADVSYELPISSALSKKGDLAQEETVFRSFTKTGDRNVQIESNIDSLKKEYFKRHPDSSRFIGDLVYFRWEEPKSRLWISKNKPKRDKDLFPSYYSYSDARHENRGKQSILLAEYYSNGELSISPLRCEMKNTSPFLTRPGFWSLRDLSQAYFSIRVNSHDIDTIRLRMDFTGVIDLVPISGVAPSSISGNGVQYTFIPEPEQIQPFDLLFYVKFRDLENSQERRIFFITAVMSAMITIFIAFIIIYIYQRFVLARDAFRGRRTQIASKWKKRGAKEKSSNNENNVDAIEFVNDEEQ